MIDYLIVGAGLYGAVCAYELNKKGFSVCVIDKRNHVGGNIFTEEVEGINVHKYGAHIFHTSNEATWRYVNQFANFNNFINSPLANYRGEIYHLPFNMNTFKEIWPDIENADDAKRHIEEEKKLYGVEDPQNLEEQAINLVGKTIYLKLVKEYTEKQWGKDCKDLPAFIIKRLPVRFEFDNNYFNDSHQGIPIGGYTKMIEKMLDGIKVVLNSNFFDKKDYYQSIAKNIIYTGPIDEYFDYCFGQLEYRSLKFIERRYDFPDYQHNAVVNYTSHDVPYTRIIEHKHFEFGTQPTTICYEEYPVEWIKGMERYYPVNNESNNLLYNKYLKLASPLKNVYFGGRLGLYKYLDMDDTLEEALKFISDLENQRNNSSKNKQIGVIKLDMSNYILSIIVPSYNTSKYVDECLPTFIDERLIGKVKILLVDDGATDDTAEKIKPYVEKHPDLFFFYHKENGGHGSVINYGVHKLVDTKYFKVIDGDDWVDTEGLVKLVDSLIESNADMVVNDYQMVFPNKTIYQKAFSGSSSDTPTLSNLAITIHSLTYKTSIFVDNAIFLREKVFYEDNQFRLFPLEYIKSFLYLPFQVYQYRLGNSEQSVSLSSGLKHKKDSDLIRSDLLKKYHDLQNNGLKGDIIEQYNKVISSMIVAGIETQLLGVPNKKEARNNMLLINSEIAKIPPIKKYALSTRSLYRVLSFTNFRFLGLIKVAYNIKNKIKK